MENRFLISISLLILGLSVTQNPVYAQQERPNVLFIAVDDMNDWTTLFDEENPIQTPNLERLADRGAFFTNAYASSPACNPSRASIMTGTRPHKTGIYGNHSDWRGALPEAQTIQQYFMEHGYYVGGAGKIFHHGRGEKWVYHDDASFHEFLLMHLNKPYPPSKINGLGWYGSRNTDWGRWPERIEQTPDYKTTEYAIDFLQKEHGKPFFLNVGIYKPHSPFFAPEEFFEEYPGQNVTMPEVKEDDWADLPSGAEALMEDKKWFWSGMLKAMEKDPGSYHEFIQAYQACATFADAMVGRVIDALDQSPYGNNTIIVLWSDHGFHLGEKEHLEKFALWEKATHVPLIFIAPKQITSGTVIDKPVDLTAIYPTLIDLAGLEEKDDLDGQSLIPLFSNPDADFPPALMTYMKGNHAIRKDHWRYIQYDDGSEELYDHRSDPHEWNNLANNSDYQKIIGDLKTYVPEENADQIPAYQR